MSMLITPRWLQSPKTSRRGLHLRKQPVAKRGRPKLGITGWGRPGWTWWRTATASHISQANWESWRGQPGQAALWRRLGWASQQRMLIQVSRRSWTKWMSSRGQSSQAGLRQHPRRVSQWAAPSWMIRRSGSAWRAGAARLTGQACKAGRSALPSGAGWVNEAGWAGGAGGMGWTWWEVEVGRSLSGEWWQAKWEEEDGLAWSDREWEWQALDDCELEQENQNHWNSAHISSLKTREDGSEYSHFLFLLSSPETDTARDKHSIANNIGEDVTYGKSQ